MWFRRKERIDTMPYGDMKIARSRWVGEDGTEYNVDFDPPIDPGRAIGLCGLAKDRFEREGLTAWRSAPFGRPACQVRVAAVEVS